MSEPATHLVVSDVDVAAPENAASENVAPRPVLKAVASNPKADDAPPQLEDGFLTATDNEQALAPFAAEAAEAAETIEKKKKSWTALHRLTAVHAVIAALAVIAVAEFVLLVAQSGSQRQPVAAVPGTGTVVVESTPAGAKLAINGVERGATPSTLTLNPGEYVMSITLGGISRTIPLAVRAGSSIEHIYLTDSGGGALAATSGTSSTKPDAPVPPPGALPRAGSVGGWLSVSSPVDLQLFEGDVLIGSTQIDRIMLPVGPHVIDAVNTTVGYKTSSRVQVAAGSVTRLKPEMPNGILNINAIPWAEVTIDGKRLGPTPLGNISLPIGSHDVVFTHPQLGERRQAVIVTLNGINRVSVNLNQR